MHIRQNEYSCRRERELVAVKWNRPGHRHHNVMHLVSSTLVTPHPDGSGRVVIRWPQKGKEPEIWEGMLEDLGSKTLEDDG